MQWWLTVFFLFGNDWVSGDRLDGWNSRAYATAAECEERRQFAELQTARYPLDVEARWICSRGRPAPEPPPAMLHAGWASSPWPVSAQWQGQPRRSALEVFTRNELERMAADGVGLRYTGPLQPPLADELRKLLLSGRKPLTHAVLELDSNGGELSYVKEVVAALKDVRTRLRLTTRVMEGGICASGCIPVFMQGEIRKASGASVWVFHGARSAVTNVPSRGATADYLSLLSDAGLEPAFRAELEEQNSIYRAGSLILSGYEVFHVHKAGIITELLPVWRAEQPQLPPPMPPSR